MNKFNYTIEGRDIQVFILFILATLVCGLANAQDNSNKTLSPYFIVLSDNPATDKLPLKKTYAEVNIAGVISDVTVHQVYKNEGKNALEAVYTFPASTNAAVYAMEMKIGSRIIKAKIEEKQKARADYEQAKSEGKRASLLEQERPNVFQMNVANIMPGDEIEVTMKYTELLIPEGGIYQFVYPTVVGPRYSGESTSTSSFVNTPYTREGILPQYNFGIHVTLNAGMPVQHVSSTSHKVAVSYPNTATADISLDPSESKGGNRDFILNYRLAGDKIESGLLLYEHGDENFFLLMVQPSQKIVKEEITPREYIFVVDVSGSMHGFPIAVSKSLLRNLIVNLRPTDKFNVVVFAGTAGTMAAESVPATLENVENACRYIDSHRGAGGTNLLSALQNAFALPRAENLSRTFVVVTDGYIDVEKEAFDLISNNRDKANIFTFGIGSSVNRYLLEGMARAGMGEPFIVTTEKEAHVVAEKFRKYINYPLLTQVKKSFQNFDAYDVEPISVPDVFSERPVVIFGKYKGPAKGSVTVKGQAGSKNYSKTFLVNEVKPSQKNAAIRYLWARKRIQMLDDYNNISPNDNAIKEVTGLGLKYNLLTAYTSFIAIEENLKANDGGLETVKQPLPLPEGVSNSAVGFEMEVDAEEGTFEAYSEIVIGQISSETLKQKVLRELEDKLIQSLTSCIISSCETISKIKVVVDSSGKVSCVSVNGEELSEVLKEQIIQIIKNWDFKKFNIGSSWGFEIKF